MSDSYIVPLQMECTLFFQMNPHAYETLDGLALRLGRTPEHLDQVLQKLVTLSILKRMGEGERAIYSYNQPDMIHVS
ncbi:hypothetical protein [Brevibacillus migulae]|uniref:hypothetical protein n=1 Tax=Brevibacillus migulae TaxID=1644114 RepID=UPI00106E7F2D|nr:hypothetical protein [Brevibacillus migulae]